MPTPSTSTPCERNARPPADLSRLLSNRSWPDLSELLDLISPSPAAVDFLARHPALEALSLPEQLDYLLTLPNLRWLWAPELTRAVAARLPRLEYAAMTKCLARCAIILEGVIRALSAFPMLRGATLSFCTNTRSASSSRVIFRSWSDSSLQGSPGIRNAEPRHKRTVSCVLPLVDLIAPGLTPSLDSASRRLHRHPYVSGASTHLDTSAVLMSDAYPAFDALLRALSAAPKLK
ncbi:hypothetical protein B0H14DRAFT_3884490 [Mycena olivaceomarginata]|nr:hypothetical protein B0H14DRAFT_3884490 [Mycena olivaceomarginata]